ncbi:hypothetical protein GJ496_000255 [Pomphorhynchus laevis]|nr:hypothetical protein GJ496_000255 [Pomphorhynchus laevis]
MCSATGGSKKVNSSSKMNEKTSDFGKKGDISKIGGVSSNNETAKKNLIDEMQQFSGLAFRMRINLKIAIQEPFAFSTAGLNSSIS